MSAIILLSVTTAFPARIAEHYAMGQLIVELTPDCRDQVNPAVSGALPSFGIPELDRLDSGRQVTRIAKLVRAPHPEEPVMRHCLDLLYLPAVDPGAERPALSNQWHLAKIHAPAAWDITHGDTNVRIGVVDGGVDYTHPDLARNL